MKILILRHCQTQANANSLWEGSGDSPLTSKGIEQSYNLAKALKGYNIEKIFCSPKIRCKQTLEIIKKFNTTINDIVYLNELIETDFGEWENKTFEIIAKQYPIEVEHFIKDYKNFVFPNGESFEHFYARCVYSIEFIISKTNNVSLVVTHGGVISCMLSYLKGYKENLFRQIKAEQGNYSLININKNFTEIELNKGD